MRKFMPVLGLGLLLAACSQTPTANSSADPTVARPVDPSAAALPVDPGAVEAVGPQATEPYNITLNFAPGSAQSVVTAMQTAAARWQGVVTQGLPSVQVNIRANSCGSNAAFSGTVDDLLVFTGSKTIDGPGGILAQSGPCSVRSSNGLTTYSTLIFDSADLAQFGSQLAAIATHELGHSLGIGTLWSRKGLIQGAGTSNPTSNGVNAVREWRALGGSGNVPIENTGGAGTRDGHWREATFNNELMTGFLNSGFNPLSRVTIGGIQDLGYQVNYGAADAYSLPAGLRQQDLQTLSLNGDIQNVEVKYRSQ